LPSRILMLCYEYPPLGGGGARVIAGLCEALQSDHDLKIDLVTMHFQGLQRLEKKATMTIHRVFTWRKDLSRCRAVEMIPYLATAAWRAMRLKRTSDYKLNHTNFIFPDGVVALAIKKLTGLPYIVTAHGSDVPGYNPDRFTRLHHLLSPLWKAVVRNADMIVCPSRTIEALVRDKAPEARTTIIPNAIDPCRFDATRPRQDRVLLVSRLFQRKGAQYLIRALAGMDLEIDTHIVGDGPYLPALKELARAEGVPVIFHGFLDNKSPDLRDLYETSRIFVFTSEAENFPVVLLEAMAAGCAIITTDGTGCAEVVGDAARLVPPRDPQALRDALSQLLADTTLCEDLGRRARERVTRLFTWQVVAAQYRKLYAPHLRQPAQGKRP